MARETVYPGLIRLSSAFQGFYARVASRLNVDPSYVSLVARGERNSPEILGALDLEMRKIMKSLKLNQDDSGHNRARRDGTHRSGVGSNSVES